MATETKTINLYDYDAKKEQPTDVDMIMDLIGKETTAGVIKQIVDKNIKNPNFDTSKPFGPANQTYIPSGTTKNENEIDKLFHTDGRTITEIRAKKDPVFKDTWLAKWEGKTKDKSAAKAGVVSGAPKGPGAAKPAVTAGAPVDTTALFED
ncbi:unnamed protein product [marine sediment metagenome]|uniref:Uncharacterized protein n=1 Tax=marine sediment metagenome TaxID=412755 RepID=X0VQH3_9ZZZZ